MNNLVLPKVCKASELNLSKSEALIVSAGFEDRVIAFANNLKFDSGTQFILLEYRPFAEKNRVDEVNTTLDKVGVSPSNRCNLIYDRMHPFGFADKLSFHLKQLKVKKVTIDISAMSKLCIMLCMSVCEQMNLDLRVFYCEAKEYGPTKTSFDHAKDENLIGRPTMNMYTGIEDVHQVNRFSSVSMHGHPVTLVAFMSFNEQFVQVLLNRISPRHLFLVNGKPPVHSWREEAVAWIHQRLLSEWSEDNPIDGSSGLPSYSSSTLDYRETLSSLSSIYWSISTQCRIILAPTGSKMQTIGCFIFRQAFKDIHIEYPTPQGFLNEYSSGIGDAWMIDFGKINKLITSFAKSEKKRELFI